MYTLGIDAFSSRSERSGVEWYAHHLLRAMEPQTPPDWRVFLYSLRENREPRSRTSSLRGRQRTENRDRGWEWKQLRWPPRRGWGQLRLSWEMLRRPPNVLFMPAATIPLVHPHRPWRKQWTVTTIHDAEFLRAPERYHPHDRRRQEFALSIACTHAARIIVPSEATRATLGDRVRDDQVAVIPLGVDHNHYRPITNRAVIDRVLMKYHIDGPYVLYVGRIDAKKNLVTLIRAGQLLERNTKLVLAGSRGFEADEVSSDGVQMLGYVPEEDLPFLYNGAQAFAFPSLNEGFGLPVLQALACGVPTVIADVPALHEVAGDAALVVDHPISNSREVRLREDVNCFMSEGMRTGGAMFPRDRDTRENGWTESLKRVLTDQALRDTLRERGLERAKKFSWERTARETWRVFEDLIQ